MGDYTTLTKIKDRLTDLQNDTTYDTPLADFITSCSRDVDRVTGSFFDLSSGVVRQYDGNGRRVLMLAKPGFNAVTQLRVKIGGQSGTWTVIPSSDYFLDPADRRAGYPAQWITLSATSSSAIFFDRGSRTVEVTGDEGWGTTPPEIADVVLNEVIQAWRERGGTREQGPDGLSPAGGRWLFSKRSLDILLDYGYGGMRFA